MDSNSLSHTKRNCKYYIVFETKFRRKIVYGQLKQDIANILGDLCKRKGENSQGINLFKLCAYVSRSTSKYKCFKFCRISKVY